uniref:Clathrin light chain n=1 Tax=Biomphalaria glabrata TaxID=6526 RepID=A0A2C9K0D3_BIOGL
MADFDAFESTPSEEVDPAADFLAREQSELAGLEDDNENFNSGQQFGNQDFDSFGQEPLALQQNTSDGLGDFEILGGGGGIDGFGADSGAQQYMGFNENISQNELSQNGPSNMYEAISQQDTLRAVPEKIKIWREEQKSRLEKKDIEEEKRKLELKEKAKKELDDWYKHHAEQLEKTKENNRKHNDVTESQGAAENAFVKDRDEKIPGQSWEKITRLCEFNPKNSKNSKDVSRFRSILLQLKQTPLVR